METKAAVIFGFKSVGHIAADGGTQSWRLDQKHVGTFEYVIIARNRHRYTPEGPEPHGSAFMIGKVCGVVPSTEPHCIADAAAGKPQRYLIMISEAALIDIPHFWKFGRWPVHIAPLAELEVDPKNYEFKPLSEFLEPDDVSEAGEELADPGDAPPPKTVPEYIAHAKGLLSTQIGVPVSAIEIAIRF